MKGREGEGKCAGESRGLLRKGSGIATTEQQENPLEVTLGPRMASLHQPSTRSEPQANICLDPLKTMSLEIMSFEIKLIL